MENKNMEHYINEIPQNDATRDMCVWIDEHVSEEKHIAELGKIFISLSDEIMKTTGEKVSLLIDQGTSHVKVLEILVNRDFQNIFCRLMREKGFFSPKIGQIQMNGKNYIFVEVMKSKIWNNEGG